jgi:hypothetical protein
LDDASRLTKLFLFFVQGKISSQKKERDNDAMAKTTGAQEEAVVL